MSKKNPPSSDEGNPLPPTNEEYRKQLAELKESLGRLEKKLDGLSGAERVKLEAEIAELKAELARIRPTQIPAAKIPAPPESSPWLF